MTKSKLSFGVWFGGPFLLCLFVFGVWLAADTGIQLTDIEHTDTWFWLGATLVFVSVVALLALGYQVIVITVYEDRIVLWNLYFRRTLLKDELRSIDFVSRERISQMGGGGEFITIESSDGKKFQSEIYFYRNAVELKQALWRWYQPIVVAPGRMGRGKTGIKVGRQEMAGREEVAYGDGGRNAWGEEVLRGKDTGQGAAGREDAGRGDRGQGTPGLGGANQGDTGKGFPGRGDTGDGREGVGQGFPVGERFSGPLLLSFRFYLFLFFIGLISQAIFSVVTEHYAHAPVLVMILLTALVLFYYVWGSYLYYFKLSEEGLIVRNSVFFWWERVYPVREIGGLVVESGARDLLGLRVRTVDFDSVLYYAGCLRDPVWRRLLERCGELDIPVVNESWI